MGGKKRPTKPAGGKVKPGAKKPKKDDNVQAMVIQAAFRKYQVPRRAPHRVVAALPVCAHGQDVCTSTRSLFVQGTRYMHVMC